jgi:LCP family protein required for cell wall assembly
VSDESRPEPSSSAPKRKGKVARRHTVGRVILVSAVVLALVTGLSTIYFIRHLDGNIEGISLGELGEDRERAYAVSIPRDSIVDRPECNDGDSAAATDVMWNAAYTEGGPVCTVAQLEAATNVFVDHFVVVDFNGFGEMVDAVGGVPVCVPEDLVDREHGIFVPAGDPSVLTGDQALDYVRARSVGELAQRNDISRIRRQQNFIAALVREVKSAGTLTRLDKVVNFLDAATSSLTTDTELDSVTRIGKIAMQLQSIGLDKVQFVTLPTEYYSTDSEFSGRVFWTEDATRIWKLINEDKQIPARLLSGNAVTAEAPSTSSEAQSPTQTPSGTATETPSETATETPSETPSETASPSETATPEAPATTEPEPVPGVCA